MLRLVAPDVALHAAWLASHREWGPGLHEDGFGIAPDDEVETPEGFARFVQRVSAPASARLWWILEEEDVVGGVARRLADAPGVQRQGHIGYGVRPSRRGRGVATWALGEVLRLAAALGLRQVLLVCADDNLPSIKTIERHGGILEGVVADDAVRLRRYPSPAECSRRAEAPFCIGQARGASSGFREPSSSVRERHWLRRVLRSRGEVLP